jgi:hypothetical protein
MTTTMKLKVPQNGEFLQHSDLHTATQLFQLLHHLFVQLVVYCSYNCATDKASHIYITVYRPISLVSCLYS